ncbi:hypothetical protein [Pseudomonas fluorescens]|uniref:Uncharacterized protein n=1 Tax=Pseudomonas fluorescens TaxID=294 RepID=A0A5E7AZB8_PSEFL|nr:hypothetical protein [Pseudomonas fluorescens]VVN79463.1 hypothetical protein PS691_00975 [Pseudomonas fluorescens]
MTAIRETFIWQGLTIEALYTPNWSESYRTTYGYALAHLQISAAGRAPLPISANRVSLALRPRQHADNIEAGGGAVACVRAWLEHAAQSPAWLDAQAQARQLSLF